MNAAILKGAIALAAAGMFGAAFAQSTPPNSAVTNPAVGAGQRSSQNTPMGTTGTPGAGGAAGSTAGATSGSATTGATAGTSGSMSAGSGSTAGSATTDTASSGSGTTQRTRVARADRG